MNIRLQKCLKAFKVLGLDSFLTSNPQNINYLTGFDKGQGWLLIEASGKLTFFCSFLYSASAQQLKSWNVATSSLEKTCNLFIGEKIRKLKLKRTGFNPDEIPFSQYRKLTNEFSRAGAVLVETEALIDKIRAIKDKSEILKIRKSVTISKEALRFANEIARPQMSEKGLSIEIDRFLRQKGDNSLAFDTIVAGGSNTVFAHHNPQDVKIGNKSFLIDLGSKYYGYCADLTRVFFWGKMPSLFHKIYDTV